MDKILNMNFFWKTIMVLVGVAIFLFTQAGCATKSKSTTTQTVTTLDANNQPVTVKTVVESQDAENVAFAKTLAPIMEKCVADIEKEDAERDKKKTVADVVGAPENCASFNSATGQAACSDNKKDLAVYAILGIALEGAFSANKPPVQSPQEFCGIAVAAIAKGYHDKEAAQAGAWKVVGVTTVAAVGVGWIFSRSADVVEGLASGQGDTITTGNISATKSDDPIGGEGGGASGSIGGQAINIGSGSSATDQAQAMGSGVVVDKNQATNFKESSSNLDGSGNPSGVVLDDRGDGSGNEVNPF